MEGERLGMDEKESAMDKYAGAFLRAQKENERHFDAKRVFSEVGRQAVARLEALHGAGMTLISQCGFVAADSMKADDVPDLRVSGRLDVNTGDKIVATCHVKTRMGALAQKATHRILGEEKFIEKMVGQICMKMAKQEARACVAGRFAPAPEMARWMKKEKLDGLAAQSLRKPKVA